MDGSKPQPDREKINRPEYPRQESEDQEISASDEREDGDAQDTGDDVEEALAAASRVADELNEEETEPLFDEDDEAVGLDAGPAQAAASAGAAEPAEDGEVEGSTDAVSARSEEALAAEAQAEADADAVRSDDAESGEPLPPVEAAAAEEAAEEAEEEAQLRQAEAAPVYAAEESDDDLEPGGIAEPPGEPGGALPAEPPTQPSRRSLAKSAAVLIGAAGALTPLAAGLWAASDPLTRDKPGDGPAGDEGFIPVGSVAAVPDDGTPRKFNVIADKKDAWTVHRNVPIGAVYLRLNDEGAIQAFNAACPHLGCFVNALPDGSFSCPCHDSEFKPDGDIRPVTRTGAKTVALRGLDELPVKISEDGQTVLVKFENFQAGLAQQKRIP